MFYSPSFSTLARAQAYKASIEGCYKHIQIIKADGKELYAVQYGN